MVDLIDILKTTYPYRHPVAYLIQKTLDPIIDDFRERVQIRLSENELEYVAIALGVSTGTLLFWIATNPEVVKEALKTVSDLGPDVSLLGGDS